MRFNLLFIVFGVIFFVLFLGLFLLLKSADGKNLQIADIIDENITSFKTSIKNNTWYSNLAKDSTKDFQPISNELYIHFELQDTSNLSKKKFYKLNIDKNDSYSLFCVKQTINNLKLKYFLINNKKYSQIVIDTNNTSLLHYLIENLKNYKIKSDFEEIWI